MKKTFDKLPYGKFIEDLKISKRNKEFINRVLKGKSSCSEQRINKYRNALTRFAYLVEKDFDKLTKEEIAEAGGIINKSNLSTKTKQDIISEIRTAYKYLFGDDEYFPKVVSALKPPKSKGRLRLPDEMPTEKDIIKMIKACSNTRDRFLIALMGLDGAIRPIEARGIKWKDVKKDKYGHYIIIHTAKKSGDKETRSVRLIKSEPYFIKWNNEYPSEKKEEAYLFINYADLNPLAQSTITALFRRLKKKLGMKVLYPYLMRHQWITRASKNPEWSSTLLKKFVGHSLASNTLSEYLHYGDDDIKDAQLLVNGIKKHKESKEAEIKPIKCPKCSKANEHDAEFCSFCNMAISQKRQLQIYEMYEENNKAMFNKIKSDFDKKLKELEKAVQKSSLPK